MNKISQQIHDLTLQGIELITQYLRENGNLTGLSDTENPLYTTYVDERAYSGCYEEVYLEDGKIFVMITDDCNYIYLCPDDLDTNKVLDILSIIEELIKI